LTNISKYLAKYAEPAAQGLARQQARTVQVGHYQNVVVIPCYSEAQDALEQVFANFSTQPLALAVIVMNAPKDAAPAQLRQTREHLAKLNAQLVRPQNITQDSAEPGAAPLMLGKLGRWQVKASFELLVIDRCSTTTQLIDPKQGVGLARKLGADIALACIHSGQVQQPWIYSTDADVQLPQDYFNQQTNGAAALSLAFKHQASDPELQRRSQLYEMHMRAYASRLAAAGSPYGYLSLGSALACSAEHYAQVRGFPKRNAGEDFYLLNKLAKTGAIVSPNSTPILLNARYSNRVPFGTGPALTNWPTAEQTFPTYPDQAFALLAELLTLFKHCSEAPAASDGEQFTQALAQLSEPIQTTLAVLDPKNELGKLFARHGSSNIPAKVKLKAAHDWFDALKTLRFVRFVSKRFEPLTLELA
jgi:hypothetical protein